MEQDDAKAESAEASADRPSEHHLGPAESLSNRTGRSRLSARTFGIAALAAAAGLAAVVGLGAGAALGASNHSPPPSGHAKNPSSGRPVLTSGSVQGLQPGATITVTGTSTVTGTPDTASFSVGASSTASSATSALAANNSQTRSLIGALETSGVASSDIQTGSVSIWPRETSGRITGFTAQDDLSVTMHDLSRVGAAIDAAARSVGNSVNLYGISFSISNDSALLAKARAGAMTSARTEAQQLAVGAGLSLGAIVKVTDEENAVQPPVYYGYGAARATASVPVQAGTQSETVQVSVVYALAG